MRLQELAIDYKIITLPSFSIFNESEHVEHYTGLESCKVMHKRLQLQSREQGSLTLLEAIGGIPAAFHLLQCIFWGSYKACCHNSCLVHLPISVGSCLFTGALHMLEDFMFSQPIHLLLELTITRNVPVLQQ